MWSTSADLAILDAGALPFPFPCRAHDEQLRTIS